MRKKREQDLNKLREKVHEIFNNFDRKLFILFTKRLEYKYKVLEQVSLLKFVTCIGS